MSIIVSIGEVIQAWIRAWINHVPVDKLHKRFAQTHGRIIAALQKEKQELTCFPSVKRVNFVYGSCKIILLTYMSIRDEINRRIEEGQLFRLLPMITGESHARTILMSTEINAMVNGPWADDVSGFRCARLRADLENFVSGAPITVCWNPHEARAVHQMARLDPIADGVWDYRSVDPSPGLRIFCRFAEKDVLVALTCRPRSKPVSWIERLPLMDDSRAWKRAIRECRHEWTRLFGAYQSLNGEDLNEYLSNPILQ